MATLDSARRSAAASTPRHSFFGRDWQLGFAFTLPVVVIIVGLIAFPLAYSVWLSLHDVKVGAAGTFVGLNNYYRVLFDASSRIHEYFLNSVRVSLLYTGGAMLGKFILGMASALILSANIIGRSFWRALLFLPWSIPAVVSAWSWKWMYNDINGVINTALLKLGIIDAPILFLGSIDLALWSVLAAVIWQGTPFWTMTFVAGLQAIPHEIYEAAEIDGASTFQSFWTITLPNMRNVIIVTVMLSAIWTSNSVQAVYILTNGGPARATETFPLLALSEGIRAYDLGMGATIPLVFFPAFAVMIYFLTRHMLRAEA